MLLKEEWIDPYALKIVSALRKKGHQAYLVGGCVRDLLAGEPPKDFDIATDALPEAARRCIPNSYVIGKRFKLVLVKRKMLILSSVKSSSLSLSKQYLKD